MYAAGYSAGTASIGRASAGAVVAGADSAAAGNWVGKAMREPSTVNSVDGPPVFVVLRGMI